LPDFFLWPQIDFGAIHRETKNPSPPVLRCASVLTDSGGPARRSPRFASGRGMVLRPSDKETKRWLNHLEP
jgi:hypothetical protein